MWEAHETLQQLPLPPNESGNDPALESKLNGLLMELESFMDDDFNSAKVLANLFEIVPSLSIH